MSNTVKSLVLAALVAPALAAAQGAAPAGDAATTTPAATAPTTGGTTAEAPKPPPWYSVVTVGGYVDGYYQLRFDAAQDAPLTQRAFDGATGFNIGHAVLSADVKPAPVGLHIDLDFGEAAQVIDNTSALASTGASGTTWANHIMQAYAAMKLGPVELDVGRFVTLAGSEVVLAKDNWLYSRSLLFYLIPITHVGARVKIPLTETLTLSGGINEGWDVVTTGYSGKTGEVQLAWSGPSSSTLALTGYFGPNPFLWTGVANTGNEWRVLVDFVGGVTLGSVGLNLNFDYGSENGKSWFGFAPMARLSVLDDALRITGRFEYVDDSDGVRFGTGVGTQVWEITAGLAYPVGTYGELRAEFRYDKANQNIFNPTKDNQMTGTLAALAWF